MGIYLFPRSFFMIKNCYKLPKIGMQRKWMNFFLFETLLGGPRLQQNTVVYNGPAKQTFLRRKTR